MRFLKFKVIVSLKDSIGIIMQSDPALGGCGARDDPFPPSSNSAGVGVSHPDALFRCETCRKTKS